MNTNKLNKAFDNVIKDKFGRSLEINDLVLYCHYNQLDTGIISGFIGNNLILHNSDGYVYSGEDVVLINDIYKEKQLSIDNISTTYNSQLEENTTVYILYCVYNNEEGVIFFKPQYKNTNSYILEYQDILKKYPDLIGFIIRRYSWAYDIFCFDHMFSDHFKFRRFNEQYKLSDKYIVYHEPIYLSNSGLNLVNCKGELLSINLKNKNVKLRSLKFPIQYNTFIPISFNLTLDHNLSLELGNNSINYPGLINTFNIVNFYESLRLFYNEIVPCGVKILHNMSEQDQKIFNCYKHLKELKLENNYLPIN